MEESVWTFKNVTLRHRRYLVLLVRWTDFTEPVSAALGEQATQFGEFMEAEGALVMPYRTKMRDAFKEVLAKAWPEPVAERMRATPYPFLVVIDRDFAAFDPAADQSAVIWFEDFEDTPEDVWKVLRAVADRIQTGDDLFAYLAGVEAKARRAKLAEKAGAAARWVDVGIPVIPGFVSVKAGAIFADVMKLFK